LTRPTQTFRYELRSSQHLDDLASSRLSNDIAANEARPSQHRDLYLDTPEDDLRGREIVCRLRLGADDKRILSLRVGSASEPTRLRVDSRVRASDVKDALAENTEAGRKLKALIDPDLLVVRLELEIDRLTREADFNWLRRPRVEIHYDAITARRAGGRRRFYQICIHPAGRNLEPAARLARALEREHHLRSVPGGLRDRAELLLRWKGSDERREESTTPRAVPRDGHGTGAAEFPDFLNPELSLLSFQSRVLALAEDEATPLKERLKFLSIVSSNLDEFVMVRMAGLRKAAREQREEQCDDGLTRGEQVELISEALREIMGRQARCFSECLGLLADVGVRLVRWRELSTRQREELRIKCREEIHPALTPMAMTLSPGHPLPHLPSLTLSLAVVLNDSNGGRLHLTELEIPADVERFLSVPEEQGHFITIEEVLRSNMDLVYPDARIEGAYVFRVTRGGDLDLDEESADDLIDAVADAAGRRSENPAVRVEVERGMPPFVRRLVLESLEREAEEQEAKFAEPDIQEIDGLLDLRSLTRLELPDIPSLSYEPFRAAEPIDENESVLEAMRRGEMIFHHPFDSFDTTVAKLVRDASEDPNVTTIKITLYRVGDPSPIVEALLAAARNGKRVVVFVELKARFDEEHNVAWARRLERAGGHVVSGLVGYKNHAKATLIIRKENGRLESYIHIGTGNYNTKSGREYTDFSLLSTRETLVADVADFFNALTGESLPPSGLSRGSLVAPQQMLDSIIGMIDREAANARAGRPARISAKFNGLSDSDVVRALLRASTDGVKIDLVVRGLCTLRPSVHGRSENIRIVSVVGRLLEHSRSYRFENDGSPEYFIGSADLRPRNLRHRVELLVPVLDAAQRQRLDSLFDLYLNDQTAWELEPSGDYVQRTGGPGAQEQLIDRLEPVQGEKVSS
jgi:polyphosphate kinase